MRQVMSLIDDSDGSSHTCTGVILAATNRPEILDPALIRAGRFDRQLLVDRPDKAGRVDILKVHLKKVKIAALTPGFSGQRPTEDRFLRSSRRKSASTARIPRAKSIVRYAS